MKVLITGGYGFIGSHVADKFHKEGYEVHILDNLSTGDQNNVTIPHKSYILSIDDPKCKNIFSTYKFDVVVHLAAQVSVASSVLNPTYDAQANIVGLLNILELSKQHGVKKFIFASSAAVYGNNTDLPLREDAVTKPISPYGISKFSSEAYCEISNGTNALETVVFRFSNVYGPRQTATGEGGVISIFTDAVLKNEPLAIHGDGQQTRDFIYVGDVAFAIFRASESMLSGVYNLSTNTQNSLLSIIDVFEQMNGPIEKTFTERRNGDIDHSSLDNTRLKRDLDWSPFYSLEEGLQLTYEWAQANATTTEAIAAKKKKKNPRKLPDPLVKIKSYAENILLFVVLSTLLLMNPIPVLTVFLFGVFYIMIIGSIYGNRQGFVAVGLATILLIIENMLNGRNLVSLLYDTTFLFQIATFLFIGLVVGYSVQRKNIVIATQKEQIDELQKRYTFLEDIHTEVRDIKDELQLRLKNNEDSFGKIYSIIKELDKLEPEYIFSRTVNVVEQIMRCKDVSIYTLNKYQSYLRLVAASENGGGQQQNSIKVADTPFVQQLMQHEKLYVNYELQSGAPLLAAPIYYNNEIHAIITINDLSFEQLSTYHENLFIVVKELIQSSLGRAMTFMKATEDIRYIDQTNVLQYDAFHEIVKSKEQTKNDYNMPYVILSMAVTAQALPTVAPQVSQLLRETDYLGFKDETLFILLSNTSTADVAFILQRFNNIGFSGVYFENDGDMKVIL